MRQTTYSPEILVDARRRLEAAPHGHKGAIIDDLARQLGISPCRVRAHLQAAGWESGRRTRSDAGHSDVITDADVYALAEAITHSRRATGKFLVDIQLGVEILRDSGRIPAAAASASTATWARHLRRLRVAKVDLAAPSLATELDSLHPNHVHMVDASIGVLFYLDGGKMRFRQLDLMDPKNKPALFAKAVTARLLLIRWVMVDHYSGAITVDYREASGERATDLADFLHYGWTDKGDRRWPVHGVPQILYADQGSAQKSALIQSLCDALDVRLLLHTSSHLRDDAAAARATGAVEVANRIWESEFESRWRFAPPTGGLQEIRAQARDFCIRLNSDPQYKLTRADRTRSQMWMDILPDQLRIPPRELADFRALAVGRPVERTLDAYGRISLDGQIFKVPHCQWPPGEVVLVRVDPWDSERVSVASQRDATSAEAIRLSIRPNGRTSAATMIGERQEKGPVGAHQPRHAAARLRQAVGEGQREKTGVAAPDRYDPQLSHQADRVPENAVLEFVPRLGTPILSTTPTGRRVDDWDVTELAVSRLGRALTADEISTIQVRLDGGRIYESEALELIETMATSQGDRRRVLSFAGGAS